MPQTVIRTCLDCAGLRLRAVALALLLCCLAPPAGAEQESRLAPTESLIIETADGVQHAFRAYLASTNEQRARGLMFFRQLPEDVGMLFLYPQPRVISMWMKNTFIPLDMLFLDARGVIINIAEQTVPHSLESIRSEGPALAVLEVNGGTARRLGIKPGDRLRHAALN